MGHRRHLLRGIGLPSEVLAPLLDLLNVHLQQGAGIGHWTSDIVHRQARQRGSLGAEGVFTSPSPSLSKKLNTATNCTQPHQVATSIVPHEGHSVIRHLAVSSNAGHLTMSVAQWKATPCTSGTGHIHCSRQPYCGTSDRHGGLGMPAWHHMHGGLGMPAFLFRYSSCSLLTKQSCKQARGTETRLVLPKARATQGSCYPRLVLPQTGNHMPIPSPPAQHVDPDPSAACGP